ncbi:hypothetical protein E2C01_024514 [Portunus trituberculatus]|uniref:Uncharacterized protein n=1 Tax=Portunus trituberculatus TaxID=210409 RepID=A0A5B7EAH8_PORTR|nr:hypothetical protein [Portunus trituberculatus]
MISDSIFLLSDIPLSLVTSIFQSSGYGMKDGSAADVSTMYGSGLGASPAGYYPYDPTFAAYGSYFVTTNWPPHIIRPFLTRPLPLRPRLRLGKEIGTGGHSALKVSLRGVNTSGAGHLLGIREVVTKSFTPNDAMLSVAFQFKGISENLYWSD